MGHRFHTQEIARARQVRAERRAVGQCPHCGGEPVLKRRMCQRCLDVHNNRITLVKSNSRCIRCPNPCVGNKTMCPECLKAANAKTRERQKRLYDEMMSHYGDVCVCCGESDRRFLSFDHINNDGRARRRETLGRKYEQMPHMEYRQLRKQGFPPILQIMCFNCNMGKLRGGGVCPHELDRRAKEKSA